MQQFMVGFAPESARTVKKQLMWYETAQMLRMESVLTVHLKRGLNLTEIVIFFRQ